MASGNVFHFKEDEYEKVAEAWANKQVIRFHEYHDPVTGKTRPLMFDGMKIEIFDTAQEARKEHWIKQGGYICRYDTFHTRHEHCECKPRQKTPKELADSQTDSGLGLKAPKTWAGTEAEWGEKNMKTLRDAFDKRKAEVRAVYDSIEKNLERYGLEWCEINKERWIEQSTTCSSLINFYKLFQNKHQYLFDAARIKFEDSQKKKVKKKEKVDVIPF